MGMDYAPGEAPGSFTGTFPDSGDWGPGEAPGGFTGTFPGADWMSGMPTQMQTQAPAQQSGGGFMDWLSNLTGGGGGGQQGSNPWSFLQNILGMGSTGGTSMLSLPLLANAVSQWRDADKYMDYGREAAGMASPITNDDRRRSLDMYRQWETDPHKFLETNPVYQGALRQGLNAAERSQAAKGNMGSGEMLMALQSVGQDTAGKFITEELRRLREDAGFQFNPAHAASLYMQGADNRMNARNGALSSLGMALTNMASGGQPVTINNQGGGPGGGGKPPGGPGGGGPNGGGGPGSPMSAAQQIQAMLAAGKTINPNDPLVASAIREMTGGDTPWSQYAPQEWDADGDGMMNYDEWANGNNSDIMDQLTGGDGGGFDGGDWADGDSFDWGDGGDWGDFEVPEAEWADFDWDSFDWDSFDW